MPFETKKAQELNLDLNKGILLSGPIGCGKTSIMALIRPFFFTTNTTTKSKRVEKYHLNSQKRLRITPELHPKEHTIAFNRLLFRRFRSRTKHKTLRQRPQRYGRNYHFTLRRLLFKINPSPTSPQTSPQAKSKHSTATASAQE